MDAHRPGARIEAPVKEIRAAVADRDVRYWHFRTFHLHRRMCTIGGKADMTLTLDNVR
jgi:hypothetical protein